MLIVVALLVAIAGTSHAQDIDSAEDDLLRRLLEGPSTRLWFTGSIMRDGVNSTGPHIFAQTTDSNSICVRTGYNGSSTHLGVAAGIGYGPYSLKLRYTDRSGHLDTIGYEFQTLGLDAAYRLQPWKTTPVLNGIGILFSGTLEGRIGDFREGFGSHREVAPGASIVTSLGIGIGYQFEFANFVIGPEYQYRKSWTNLAAGDDIYSFLHSIGATFGFTSDPAPPTASTSSIVFSNDVSEEWDFYIVPWRLRDQALKEYELVNTQCQTGKLNLSALWKRRQIKDEMFTLAYPLGPYVVMAITRPDKNGCWRFSVPERIDFNNALPQWMFKFDSKKCGCN